MKYYIRSGVLRCVVNAPNEEEALLSAITYHINKYRRGETPSLERMITSYADLGYVAVVNQHGFEIREGDRYLETAPFLMSVLRQMAKENK